MPCLKPQDDDSDDDSLGNIINIEEQEEDESTAATPVEASSAATIEHVDDRNSEDHINQKSDDNNEPRERDLTVPFPTFGDPEIVQKSNKKRSKSQQKRGIQFDMAGSPSPPRANNQERHILSAKYVSYPPTEARIPTDIVVPDELCDAQPVRNPVLFSDTSLNPKLISRFSRPLMEPWDRSETNVVIPNPEDIFKSIAKKESTSEGLQPARPRTSIKSKVIKKTLQISAGKEDIDVNPPGLISLLEKSNIRRRSVSRGGVRVVVDSHQILSNGGCSLPNTYTRRKLSSILPHQHSNSNNITEDVTTTAAADPDIQLKDFSTWLSSSLTQWVDSDTASSVVRSSVKEHLDYNTAFC